MMIMMIIKYRTIHYTIDKVKIKFIEAFGGHRIPGVWDGQAESCWLASISDGIKVLLKHSKNEKAVVARSFNMKEVVIEGEAWNKQVKIIDSRGHFFIL